MLNGLEKNKNFNAYNKLIFIDKFFVSLVKNLSKEMPWVIHALIGF